MNTNKQKGISTGLIVIAAIFTVVGFYFLDRAERKEAAEVCGFAGDMEFSAASLVLGFKNTNQFSQEQYQQAAKDMSALMNKRFKHGCQERRG